MQTFSFVRQFVQQRKSLAIIHFQQQEKFYLRVIKNRLKIPIFCHWNWYFNFLIWFIFQKPPENVNFLHMSKGTWNQAVPQEVRDLFRQLRHLFDGVIKVALIKKSPSSCPLHFSLFVDQSLARIWK